MSECTCQNAPAAGNEPTELDQAVEQVITATAERLDALVSEKLAAAGINAGSDDATDGDEPVTAAPGDVSETYIQELEMRITQLEEAVSSLIVESTPEMEGMES